MFYFFADIFGLKNKLFVREWKNYDFSWTFLELEKVRGGKQTFLAFSVQNRPKFGCIFSVHSIFYSAADQSASWQHFSYGAGGGGEGKLKFQTGLPAICQKRSTRVCFKCP
jgi:hypothetical protein